MTSVIDAARIASENPFKAALARRERLMGYWNSLTSNLLTEIAGEAGFDWMFIDTEHAPNDLQRLIGQLQALRGSATQAVARPLLNDPIYIKQLLDIGFRNIVVPYVQTVEDAQRAVSATRYPPAGVRGVSGYHRNNGYGRKTDYFQYIDQSIGVIAQIESASAMHQLEAIGKVPGIDALFVGPGDLAASLGRVGQVQHPDTQDAIREIGQRAQAAGLSLGIAAGSAADIARYISWGYNFFTAGSDVTLFRGALATMLDSLAPLRKA